MTATAFRTTRARRPRSPRVGRKTTPEALVVRTIRDGLNARRIPNFRMNAGSFLIGEPGAKRFFRAGFKGCPDLLVLLPGSAGFIEVKAPRGRLSLVQAGFGEQCKRLGIPWLYARSWDEVEAWLP